MKKTFLNNIAKLVLCTYVTSLSAGAGTMQTANSLQSRYQKASHLLKQKDASALKKLYAPTLANQRDESLFRAISALPSLPELKEGPIANQYLLQIDGQDLLIDARKISAGLLSVGGVQIDIQRNNTLSKLKNVLDQSWQGFRFENKNRSWLSHLWKESASLWMPEAHAFSWLLAGGIALAVLGVFLAYRAGKKSGEENAKEAVVEKIKNGELPPWHGRHFRRNSSTSSDSEGEAIHLDASTTSVSSSSSSSDSDLTSDEGDTIESL